MMFVGDNRKHKREVFPKKCLGPDGRQRDSSVSLWCRSRAYLTCGSSFVGLSAAIMWILRLLSLFVLLGHGVLGSPTARHILHERRSLNDQWKRQQKLPSDTFMPMRIGLAQQNLHRVGEILNQVSHPDSPEYGKHWTAEQLADTFGSSQETVNAVKEWLGENDIPASRVSHHRNNWLEVNVTAQEAEQLLHAEYFVHENVHDGREKAACDEYYIPKALQGHIDFITPTVHFDSNTQREKKRKRTKRALPECHDNIIRPAIIPCLTCAPGMNPSDPETYIGDCAKSVTPACLRALYGLPDPDTIKPFTDARVPLGLVEFSPASQYPPDLDDFFIKYTGSCYGKGQPRHISINGGVPYPDPENHPEHFTEPDGDIEIAWSIVYPNDVAIYQIGDGGSFDSFLDALDGTYCDSGGGPGTNASNPQCGSASGRDLADVISISWTNGEADFSPRYLERQCNEFGKLGTLGVTVLAASGDSGVGNNCTNPLTGLLTNDTSPGTYKVQFPASCPFVTAVGGTRVPSAPPFEPGDLEVAMASDSDFDPFSSWARLRSGGGFSNVFAAPVWQSPTMQAYAAKHAPSRVSADGKSLYNNSRHMRGFPDISANGYKFSAVVNSKTSMFSGTSGSTPMVAGTIALINGERLAQSPRKGSVGFINPVLYQYPYILNDVVEGDNRGCGTEGFQCVEGWDPVTGLGTPNYEKMSGLWNSLP